MPKHAAVTYRGRALVLLRFEDGDGALAFPDQVRDDGYIKPECLLEPGFAHIDHDGQIWRAKSGGRKNVLSYLDDDADLARAWDSLA